MLAGVSVTETLVAAIEYTVSNGPSREAEELVSEIEVANTPIKAAELPVALGPLSSPKPNVADDPGCSPTLELKFTLEVEFEVKDHPAGGVGDPPKAQPTGTKKMTLVRLEAAEVGLVTFAENEVGTAPTTTLGKGTSDGEVTFETRYGTRTPARGLPSPVTKSYPVVAEQMEPHAPLVPEVMSRNLLAFAGPEAAAYKAVEAP